MGTARRISRNTAYLAAAEMVSKVLQFVVMIYAARLLSQEDFGKFSFALSLSFIAMILADWGLNQLLVRTVARDKGGLEKYVANSIFLKIIFSALSGAFIVIVLNLFRYPQTTKGIVYIIWLFAMRALMKYESSEVTIIRARKIRKMVVNYKNHKSLSGT